MTARAIGVFALVLAMASPALAQPANSVIGGKKLEEEMVHSAAVGYPSTYYEWWNKGKKNLDWAIIGELVYGDFTAAGNKGRLIRIGGGRRRRGSAGTSSKRRRPKSPTTSRFS